MEKQLMRESLSANQFSFGYSSLNGSEAQGTMAVAPFFSMRKLRLVYNELMGSGEFEFSTFDEFKHQVLNSVAPQLELNKWQAIAARR